MITQENRSWPQVGLTGLMTEPRREEISQQTVSMCCPPLLSHNMTLWSVLLCGSFIVKTFHHNKSIQTIRTLKILNYPFELTFCFLQSLITMSPDQRKESVSVSHQNPLDSGEKVQPYTLEEFSYDHFRWTALHFTLFCVWRVKPQLYTFRYFYHLISLPTSLCRINSSHCVSSVF